MDGRGESQRLRLGGGTNGGKNAKQARFTIKIGNSSEKRTTRTALKTPTEGIKREDEMAGKGIRRGGELDTRT